MKEATKEKIAKILLLFDSDKEGEVLAAVQALRRLLAGENINLHHLAKSLTNPEIKTVYRDKIIEKTVERVVYRTVPVADCSHNEIASWCLGQDLSRINEREKHFLRDMAAKTDKLSERQNAWLIAIHRKLSSKQARLS